MSKTSEYFDQWNGIKKSIHFGNTKNFFVKQKQVRYIHAGVNIGNEVDGKGADAKRAVLVLGKVGNMFLVVHMTTKGKDDTMFYYLLDESYFDKKSYVMLTHIRTIDKKRFIEQLGELSGTDFRAIKKEIQTMYFGNSSSIFSSRRTGEDPQ